MPSLHRGQGRVGRPWRRIQAQVFAQESVCWICGWPVDKSLPHTDPMSKSVDHVQSLAMRGAPLERANCRLAHLGCNSRRGDGTRVMQGRTSRQW